MDCFIKIADEMRTKMWRTAGARYLAAGRFQRRERYSTFSIAVLSVVAIGIGLLNPQLDAAASRLGLTTVSIAAIISVFILVISLIEGSARTAVQASKLHDNAVAISEIRTALESMLAKAKAAGTESWQEFDNLREEYERCIRECPFNHEPIDNLMFEATRRGSPEFSGSDGKPRMTWVRCQWVKFWHVTSTAWLACISWIAVGALIIVPIDWDMSNDSAASHTAIDSSQRKKNEIGGAV